MSTPLTYRLDTLLDVASQATANPYAWQRVIRQARLFIVVWSDKVGLSPDMAARMAYATHVGTPIRILLADDTRLPEDAFLAYADVEVARAETPEAAGAQIEAWLDALPPREEGR